MRRGAFFSAVLHLAVILLAYFGLPHLMRPPLDIGEAVPVELVTLAEKTNIPPTAPQAEPKPLPKQAVTPPAPPPLPEPPKPAPPPPVENSAPPTPPPPVVTTPPPAPPPPIVNAAPPTPPQLPPPAPPTPPEPPKPAPPVVAAVPPAEESTPKSKPKPEPPKPEARVPPPPPPPPPPKQKTEPKPQPDQLASILKSLDENKPRIEQKPQPQQPDLERVLKTVTQATPRQDQAQNVVREFARPTQTTASLDQRLSISEIDAVRRQIEGCWNIPAGAKDAKNLVVELRVQLNVDGSVRAVSITDQGRLQSDGFFRAAAESAERAVYECAPLHLPPDKYSQWQDMILNFDPSQVL